MSAPHRSVANIRGGQGPGGSGSGITPSSPHTPARAAPSAFGSPSTLRAEEDLLVIEIGSRFGVGGGCRGRLDEAREGSRWGEDYELWRHLLIDSKPRRTALVLPASLPLPLLSTTLDLMFNTFQSPTISLLSSATMTAIAAGVRSALVVDLGWAETVVTTIYEYREVSCTRSVRGGKHLVSSLHRIIRDALREQGTTVAETDEDEVEERHILSFGECEDICTRVVWCKPSNGTAQARRGQRDGNGAGEEDGEGLATVQEQDELEHEVPSAAREAKTITIPLQTTRPPTRLKVRFSRLADACESTYFEERPGAPYTFDDEELPVHWLVYQHLLHLPLDVRAICMSRIIFTGGCSKILGLKGRAFDEVAELARTRDWDPVTGRGADARGRRQPGLSGSPAQDEDEDGVWHDAANAGPETNAIDEKLDRRKTTRVVQGELRALESLGPWAGAAWRVSSRCRRPADVDVKTQQRQSLGAGGLMRGAAGARIGRGLWGIPNNDGGPTYAPPPLPAGWIAQWDGASRKYYFVQLSTGDSQWETPTEAAPTGVTPGPNVDHPYGTPPLAEIITHPDGSQTRKHPDGTMEPVLPTDGSRGMGDGTGDRGFGSMAFNLLAGGNKKQSQQSSSPLGLAGQLIGSVAGGGGHGGSSSGGKNSGAGKLVGALASNLFSSGGSGSKPPQNYHGDTSSSSHSNNAHGAAAGGLMGGVASFLGGGKHNQSGQNFGYSGAGTGGTYSGQEPPSSYQAPTGGSAAPLRARIRSLSRISLPRPSSLMITILLLPARIIISPAMDPGKDKDRVMAKAKAKGMAVRTTARVTDRVMARARARATVRDTDLPGPTLDTALDSLATDNNSISSNKAPTTMALLPASPATAVPRAKGKEGTVVLRAMAKVVMAALQAKVKVATAVLKAKARAAMVGLRARAKPSYGAPPSQSSYGSSNQPSYGQPPTHYGGSGAGSHTGQSYQPPSQYGSGNSNSQQFGNNPQF
ncbi:unnamed protein product [Parascedosporium putredinis]|uniref:WW domain-containing protein n=1 Tax=Parascedosporium putredinis TaxID=1442378 RepID=A0A9P1GWF1_9PEZI|nr:unnamed protein product [Parascedosporium putredinis]CAI7988725.1 unnamed protein product [Parascedosporium putredinis]